MHLYFYVCIFLQPVNMMVLNISGFFICRFVKNSIPYSHEVTWYPPCLTTLHAEACVKLSTLLLFYPVSQYSPQLHS